MPHSCIQHWLTRRICYLENLSQLPKVLNVIYWKTTSIDQKIRLITGNNTVQKYRYQCYGSEFIFFIRIWIRIQTFFRIRFRILRLLFWPEICLNGVAHFFHAGTGMCSGTCTAEKKKSFPIEKNTVLSFSFMYLILDFSQHFLF
jgi:hypothetical protein